MLTRIYRRDPLGFTLVCIAAYVLAVGLGNGLSERLGAAYSGNALLAALFICRAARLERQGRPAADTGALPPEGSRTAGALVRAARGRRRVQPCWADSAAYRGRRRRLPPRPCSAPGVLEEILFRGLLLGALMPRGPRRAVWLSALAFGLVHALNLLGGAGAGETAAQIVCACAVGVMLALLTLRCGSILPGAAMHGALNVLSALTAPADAREKSPDRRAP